MTILHNMCAGALRLMGRRPMETVHLETISDHHGTELIEIIKNLLGDVG